MFEYRCKLKGFFLYDSLLEAVFFLLLSILFQLELLHKEEPEFFLSFFLFFTPAQGRNRYLLEIRRCQIHVAPHLCVNILKSAEILRCPALNYCCYSFLFLLLRLKHHRGTRSCSSHFIVECFFTVGICSFTSCKCTTYFRPHYKLCPRYVHITATVAPNSTSLMEILIYAPKRWKMSQLYGFKILPKFYK